MKTWLCYTWDEAWEGIRLYQKLIGKNDNHARVFSIVRRINGEDIRYWAVQYVQS